jgi:hypothetical protein
MPIVDKDTLKSYFKTKVVPNESNYVDLIDSLMGVSGSSINNEGPGIDIIDTQIGIGGDSILLYDFNGTNPVSEFSLTDEGLTLALAASGSGDFILLPAADIWGGPWTIPAGRHLMGYGFDKTTLSGSIILGIGSSMSNLRLQTNPPSSILNVPSGAADVYSCSIDVEITLTGAAQINLYACHLWPSGSLPSNAHVLGNYFGTGILSGNARLSDRAPYNPAYLLLNGTPSPALPNGRVLTDGELIGITDSGANGSAILNVHLHHIYKISPEGTTREYPETDEGLTAALLESESGDNICIPAKQITGGPWIIPNGVEVSGLGYTSWLDGEVGGAEDASAYLSNLRVTTLLEEDPGQSDFELTPILEVQGHETEHEPPYEHGASFYGTRGYTAWNHTTSELEWGSGTPSSPGAIWSIDVENELVDVIQWRINLKCIAFSTDAPIDQISILHCSMADVDYIDPVLYTPKLWGSGYGSGATWGSGTTRPTIGEVRPALCSSFSPTTYSVGTYYFGLQHRSNNWWDAVGTIEIQSIEYKIGENWYTLNTTPISAITALNIHGVRCDNLVGIAEISDRAPWDIEYIVSTSGSPSVYLPNSRKLVGGTGITIDYTTAGSVVVNEDPGPDYVDGNGSPLKVALWIDNDTLTYVNYGTTPSDINSSGSTAGTSGSPADSTHKHYLPLGDNLSWIGDRLTAVSGPNGSALAYVDRGNIFDTGTQVFNESGGDNDFRVEASSGSPNMLFVDASAGRVGINTNAPSAKLHIVQSVASVAGGILLTETGGVYGGGFYREDGTLGGLVVRNQSVDTLWIKNSRLGIMNNNPAVALDVTGSAIVSGSVTASGIIRSNTGFNINGTSGATGSGNTVTVNAGIVTSISTSGGASSGVITFVWDGGGAVITTPKVQDVYLPSSGSITGWYIMADVATNATVDLWVDTFANYPPTVSDTIVGGNYVSLTGVNHNSDTTLTSWNKYPIAGSTMRANISACSAATKITLTILYTKS